MHKSCLVFLALVSGVIHAWEPTSEPRCPTNKSSVLQALSAATEQSEAHIEKVATGVWYNWSVLRGGATCLFIEEKKRHYAIRVFNNYTDFDSSDELGVCLAGAKSKSDFLAEANLQGKGFEIIEIKVDQNFSQVEVLKDKLKGKYQRIKASESLSYCGTDL